MESVRPPMERVVVVLGGNAFAGSSGEMSMAGQLEFAHEAMRQVLPLWPPETRLLISHGNGPQVGHILRRVEAAVDGSYRLPLDVCVAESEGELGFVLEQAIRNVSQEQGRPREAVTLLTQVLVDPQDPAFARPAKPIGPFLNAQAARQLTAAGVLVGEDAGRGLRRIVPSPLPQAIVEWEAVRMLLEAGQIVIAAGGGGIPVVRDAAGYRGVEAVVDKDWTAALLARQWNADLLVILTCVPCASLHFGTSRQQAIRQATPEEAQVWLEQGHFAPGSMAPKIGAAIRFASAAGRRAIICDPPSLAGALCGAAGTVIAASPSDPAR